ncbi:hypothetical protein EJB05_57962, partial [Eragrostis curvula]
MRKRYREDDLFKDAPQPQQHPDAGGEPEEAEQKARVLPAAMWAVQAPPTNSSAGAFWMQPAWPFGGGGHAGAGTVQAPLQFMSTRSFPGGGMGDSNNNNSNIGMLAALNASGGGGVQHQPETATIAQRHRTNGGDSGGHSAASPQ